MKKIFAASTLMICLLSPSVQAADWVFDRSHTRIGFDVGHLGFSRTHGDFRQFDGTVSFDPAKPAQTRISVNIDVNSLDTGWAARDEHLRKADYFDVARFPAMRFVSTQVRPAGKDQLNITGNLTLHGVTRPVILLTRINKIGINPMNQKRVAGFTATTTLKRSDFGMTTAIPAVTDEVSVRIDGELTEPAAAASAKPATAGQTVGKSGN